MATRILAILLFAPPFLWCVHRGGFALAVVLGGLAGMALHELLRLHKLPPAGMPLLAAAFALGACGPRGPGPVLAGLALFALVGALPLAFPPVAPERLQRAVVGLAAGALYGLGFALFGLLRSMPGGLAVAGAVLALVWVQDSAAYLVGRAIGRTPFAPAISPKKTWEGAIGGLVLGVPAAGWTLTALGGGWEHLGAGGAPGGYAILTVAAALAQLGDLAESGMKRAAGIKDSGDLIPGHGGVLDRFDAFAFAVLAVALARLGGG